jgi:hypothetical protein
MRVERKIALPIRQQPDDLWEQLLALAQRAEPATKKQFLEALVKLNGNLDVGAIEDALSRGDIAAVVDAIPWDELKEALESIETALEDVRSRAFELSRGAAEPMLDPQQLAIHLGERSTLAISWRHVSSFVLDAIRARTGDRITQVTDETRAAVRQLVERTYSEGGHARTMIPAIRQTIGLTSRQERAVARYAASLAEGKRPADRVERMVARYRKKLINYRAELIARTETLQAMNDGQRASWSTLVERGLLDSNRFEREWLAIVPSNGRTCPICTDLDGARAPIDGQYAGSGDIGPPQHPDCRCVEKVVPIDAPVDNDADVAVS